MTMIPHEEADQQMKNGPSLVQGGAFNNTVDQSPFGFGSGEGADAGRGDVGWVVAKERWKFDEMFQTLDPVNGKITGNIPITVFSSTDLTACETVYRFKLLQPAKGSLSSPVGYNNRMICCLL